MSISVIIDLGTTKIAVRQSNFKTNGITYNWDGSVHAFVLEGDSKRFIRCVRGSTYFGYLNEENYIKQHERYAKKETVTTAQWLIGAFTGFDALAKAQSGDTLEGAYAVFSSSGRCKQIHHYAYTGTIPNSATFSLPANIYSASPPTECDNFGGSGTHAGKFYDDFNSVTFYDGTNSLPDRELVGEIAKLMKDAGEQTAEAFQNFVVAGVNTTQFTFYPDVTGSFSRQDFLNYRDGLKLWLSMLKDYKDKLKGLNDAEKLFIYIDVLYRHNMLVALDVQQKIDILTAMVKGPLISWYFASWKNGFQNRELLALYVIKSITAAQADEFLEKMISTRVNGIGIQSSKIYTLYKALFYRIDDFWGDDRFTDFANELNRLVLAKNNIVQSTSGMVMATASQLTSLVQYSFIWNNKSNSDFRGEVEYDLTYPDFETINVHEKVCTEVRDGYPYADEGGSGPAVPYASGFEETDHVLEHFALVSITYLTNPSFLDLCQYGNCTNMSFLASAGYIDYLLEKENTDTILTVLSTSVQLLSLVFGVGELLLAIRTANVVRGIIGAYVVAGDIYAMVINSTAFNQYLMDAYPDTYQDIQSTLRMVSIIHGVTALGASITYTAYNVSQANKFIGEVDALKLNPGAMGRMSVEEVKALNKTRERLLAEMYVLRQNAATRQIIDNEIMAARNARNLQILNSVRGSQAEWDLAKQTIADFRLAQGGSVGNYGYVDGLINSTAVNAITDSQTGNQIFRSVSSTIANTEPHVFTPTIVGGWSRNTDSEFRMLNKLALHFEPNAQLGNVYSSYSGTIKIVSEKAYCTSCQGIIQQFNDMFPNVNIVLIDAVRLP